MLKRKPRFYTFFATIVVVGLVPLVANSDAGISPPTQQAGTPPQGQGAPQKPAAPDTSKAQATPADGPSPDKLLSASEASGVLQDLAIKAIDNKAAYLTGLFPAACSGMIEIQSTTSNSDVKVGDTQGFSVHDKGGFVSCVTKVGKCVNGYSGDQQKCSFVSSLAKPIQLDPNSDKSIPVAYMNSVVADPIVGGSWAAVNIGKPVKLLSQKDIDLAAKQKAQQVLEAKNAAAQESITCQAKNGDFTAARSLLEKSSLDDETKSELEKKISGYIKTFDQKDLTKIISDCNSSIKLAKYDDFDTCASNLDDFFSASDIGGSLQADETESRCKLGAGQAVDVTNSMAKALTTAADVGQDQIDHAKALLEHLADTSDNGMGCELTAAQEKIVNMGLKEGVVSAEAQVKYSDFTKSLDSVSNATLVLSPSAAFPYGGRLPVSETSCAPTGSDPASIEAMIDLWKTAHVIGTNKAGQQVEAKNVESACKSYLESALKSSKSLASDMKMQKCVDSFGNPSDNPTSGCKDLQAFQDQLTGIPSSIAQMHAQSVQNQRAVANAALSGLSGQQGQNANAGISALGGTAGSQASLYQNPALASLYGRSQIPTSTFGAQTGNPMMSQLQMPQMQGQQGAVYMPQNLVNVY